MRSERSERPAVLWTSPGFLEAYRRGVDETGNRGLPTVAGPVPAVNDSKPVAGCDLLPIAALFDIQQKESGTAWLLPLFLGRILFPGLSRCGVSDGDAKRRGTSRIDV